MDQLLDGGAIDADDFIPAVDQRVGGHGRWQRSLVGHDLKPLLLLNREAKNLADDLGLFVVQRHLAQAGGGDPLLALANFFGHGFPLDALGHFDGDDFFGDFVAVHADSLLLLS